jgi:hypothetical protein
LGKLTYNTKESFLAGEQAQPGVPFKLLNTWSSCNAVTFRYVLSPPGLDVQGIAVAEVEEAKKNNTGVGEGSKKWQIKTFYGEFNSAVWLTDLKDKISGCDVRSNVTGNGTVAWSGFEMAVGGAVGLGLGVAIWLCMDRLGRSKG